MLTPSQGASSSVANVTISDATSGVTIYYTTNGANPTTSSSTVSSGGTISVNRNTTLKVQAYQGSNNPSDIIAATYSGTGVISASSGHTVVLSSSGSAWAFGNNTSGQLGLGNNSPANLPAPISTQSGFTNTAPIVSIKTYTVPYENGLPIPYEYQYYGATGQNPNSVPNGNGLTLLQNAQQGNNPTNYYSQGGQIISPTVAIVSGNLQAGSASAVLPNPLVVSVTNPGGGNLNTAPVTFSVPSGQGQLSTSSSGTSPSNSITVSTNSSGRAQIYLILPSSGSTTTVTAAAPTTGSQAQFTEIVSNIPTSGLAGWFSADHGVTASGGTVTRWADRSSNGYNLTPISGVNAPATGTDPASGAPVLSFDGTDALESNSTVSGVNDVTIITAAATLDFGNTHALVTVGDATNGTTSRASLYQFDFTPGAQGFYQGFCNGTTFVHGGPAPTDSGINVSSMTYSHSSGAATFYLNGNSNGTSTDSTSAISSSLTIGSLLNYTSYLGWDGNVAEVLIYNRILTTTERQQVELYLANKYLTYAPGAAWISAYPSDVQSQINQNQWTKAQADKYVQLAQSLPVVAGLTGWYKADSTFLSDDPNNPGSTTWKDSSLNHNDLTQSDPDSQPTLTMDPISGRPMVNFVGSQNDGTGEFLYANDGQILAAGNDSTLIVVGSDGDPGNQDTFVSIGNNGEGAQRNYVIAADGNQSYYDGNDPDTVVEGGPAEVSTTITTSSDGSRSINSSTLNLGAMTYSYSGSPQTVSFYNEGTPNGSTSFSSAALSPGLTLGSSLSYTPWLPLNGNIAEVLIYNRVLSTMERQQIELYLVNKYKLAYSTAAPTISPNGGSATSSLSITLSGAPSPAVIRYTLDGSTPTSASPLYNGSLTLTQSAPLTCASFLNTTPISPTSAAQFYVGDSGGIGISDAWQQEYYGTTGINPNALVPGGSGLTNLQAYLWGYNPLMYSTNGDGLSDLTNHLLGISASNTDINNYGLTNAEQLALGLDPFSNFNPPQPPPLPPNPGNQNYPVINLVNPPGAVLIP
ncbi:MAG: chitobiase/beta-hexosaminidase C-terminal domain-containing protein [Verrucomicrobiota bacterium]